MMSYAWQDISTAPKKDGFRAVLAWAGSDNWVVTGFWSLGYHGLWCDEATEDDFVPQPTHWMPIPQPPAHEGTVE
jgi:hypothetical protein